MKMGVEQLQLFVRFSNICGLIPFRMILDEQAKRFQRFEGHWRHPANWWFTFQFIGFLLFLFFCVLHLLLMMKGDIGSMSIVFLAVYILYFSNALVITSIPRLFLIRFRRFESAIEILHQIDRMIRVMGKMRHTSCTTRQRTLIGIGFSFVSVFSFNYVITYCNSLRPFDLDSGLHFYDVFSIREIL